MVLGFGKMNLIETLGELSLFNLLREVYVGELFGKFNATIWPAVVRSKKRGIRSRSFRERIRYRVRLCDIKINWSIILVKLLLLLLLMLQLQLLLLLLMLQEATVSNGRWTIVVVQARCRTTVTVRACVLNASVMVRRFSIIPFHDFKK